MKFYAPVPLSLAPEQRSRVLALQADFVQACNALAPLVQRSACWNRVALHHMAYRGLREAFPQLGSQMVCNVIYSVCRVARQVYQGPGSPFHVSRLGGKGLPLLRFGERAPVYFDRHTLSLRGDALSLFTPQGRLRLQVPLPAGLQAGLAAGALKEAVLSRDAAGVFSLGFLLDAPDQPPAAAPVLQPPLTEYVQVEVSHS